MNKLLKSFLFTTILSSTMSLDTEVGFNFDNNQSPLSGSRNIASLVSIGSSIFDKRIPKNTLLRIGSIYARAVTNMAVMVFNHEYYGHGFALKHLDIGLKEIELIIPNILGMGIVVFEKDKPYFGLTEYKDKNKYESSSINKKIFTTISGSHASTNCSQQQILNNFHKDKIGNFLIESIFLTNIDYSIYSTIGILYPESSNNDIGMWRKYLKDKYSKKVVDSNDLYYSLISLLSPINYMLIKSTFNYILYEDSFNEWLCFKSGDFKYLPNFRTETTPFGLAYALDNFFTYNERTFLFSFSGLNDPSKRFIFTFDLRSNNLFTSEFVDFDLRSVFARQPIEEVDSTSLIEDKGTFFGYMIQPSLRLKLNKFKIYLDYTTKNSVFIPAAPYREGHYFNIGLSYTFDA